MKVPHSYGKIITVFISLIFGLDTGASMLVATPAQLHGASSQTHEISSSCQTACLPLQIKKVKLPHVSSKKRLSHFAIHLGYGNIYPIKKDTYTLTAFLYTQSSWIPPDIILLQGLTQTSR